jgi:ABC-type dipeptide/oligopeptide/nickel transport system permease component
VNRGHFILRRLAQMIPVLFGITLVVFALLQLIPGDPATTMLGLQARPEAVAASSGSTAPSGSSTYAILATWSDLTSGIR